MSIPEPQAPYQDTEPKAPVSLRQLRVSHISAGLTAVLVGYASAVLLVIEAARAAGATSEIIISWLTALGVGMGLSCIGFSLYYRVPVVTAWSTPGAAFLIVSAPAFSLTEVVGACVAAGALGVIAAKSRQLSRLLTSIPPAIASAMLAGILLPICMQIFTGFGASPLITAVFLLIFIIGTLLFPRYLMLALLILALITTATINNSDVEVTSAPLSLPSLVLVPPHFSGAALIGLAVPLFLITLLSQNLPGLAILRSQQYTVAPGPLLGGTSLLQCILAPVGGFTFNLAAITAAICMGENAGQYAGHRYWAAVFAGIGYLVMGLLSAGVVIVISAMPEVVIHLLAGLALLPTLQNTLTQSFEHNELRAPAVLTLLCSASGISMGFVSAPVAGLLIGLLLYLLQRQLSLRSA